MTRRGNDKTTETLATIRPRAVGSWILQLVAAGMFLLSGTLKLTGAPMTVQLFDAIGAGQWFRYLIGTIEVGGALLLLVPSLVLFGALPLAATWPAPC